MYSMDDIAEAYDKVAQWKNVRFDAVLKGYRKTSYHPETTIIFFPISK